MTDTQDAEDPRVVALAREAERRVADTVAGLLKGRDPDVPFEDALSAALSGVLVACVTAGAAASPVGTDVRDVVEDLVTGLRLVGETWDGAGDAPTLASAADQVRQEEELPCEACDRDVLPGHLVRRYEDVGEVHVDCDDPLGEKVDPADLPEDPAAHRPAAYRVGEDLVRRRADA